jgi:hypothetical protein
MPKDRRRPTSVAADAAWLARVGQQRELFIAHISQLNAVLGVTFARSTSTI